MIDLTGNPPSAGRPSAKGGTPGSWRFRAQFIADASDVDEIADAATDPDVFVRASAAGNVNCPWGAFVDLVTDTQATVRSRAAANPACPPWALQDLAFDPDDMVRSSVANNPACPPGLQSVLAADDQSPAVRAIAQRHPILRYLRRR